MLHTIGSLTKLFYEAVESAQDKPVRGLAACGASHLQRIRFALWPQVKPIFLSYGFMRLEINFRSSTILGLVGAGGIGQELMTNIKLDRYDQVSITLLLIIIVVSLLDMLSGRLRQWVLEGKNESVAKSTGYRRQPSPASAFIPGPGALSALRRPACAGQRPLLCWFFMQFDQRRAARHGLQQISHYLLRMFVWHDFFNWPFRYYFTQIAITLAIVFAGTLTATVIALLLSFLARGILCAA